MSNNGHYVSGHSGSPIVCVTDNIEIHLSTQGSAVGLKDSSRLTSAVWCGRVNAATYVCSPAHITGGAPYDSVASLCNAHVVTT